MTQRMSISREGCQPVPVTFDTKTGQVHFAMPGPDSLSQAETAVLAQLRAASLRSWSAAPEGKPSSGGFVTSDDARLYPPPQHGPAVRDALVALLRGDPQPALTLIERIDPAADIPGPVEAPPRGQARCVGGPLHGALTRSRANYLDDTGQRVATSAGDRLWCGVNPVPSRFYAHRSGHYYVHWSVWDAWAPRWAAMVAAHRPW